MQDNTLIAVIELSDSSWLVDGAVPGVERQPLKKLDPDAKELLRLLDRGRGGLPMTIRGGGDPSLNMVV